MDNPIDDNRRRPTDSARRTPRKRAVRKRASRNKSESETSSPRVSKSEPKIEATNRKAPTPIAAKKAKKKFKHRRLVIVGMVIIIGIGSSAMVGFTDDGQINVQQAIAERNERVRNSQASSENNATSNIEIPVQNTNNSNRPNGGLRGLGVADTDSDRKKREVDNINNSTSTAEVATSTDMTASTTEESVGVEDESATSSESEPSN